MQQESITRSPVLIERPANTHGGNRYNHQTLAVSKIEDLVVEVVAARHELADTRLRRSLMEVETLARAVLHHLQAMQSEAAA